MSDVLLFVLGFAGCAIVLARIILPPLPPRQTMTDRWCELTDKLHEKS